DPVAVRLLQRDPPRRGDPAQARVRSPGGTEGAAPRALPAGGRGTGRPGAGTVSAPAARARDATDRGGMMAQAPSRLLVVDDNEMNRDMLARRLQRLGHETCMAGDGREALALLRSQPFDLVLLDITMPEMDGYEVLLQLRSDEALRHIPVVMVSAIEEVDSVVRCLELGAEDYLGKPFNPLVLKARVDASL